MPRGVLAAEKHKKQLRKNAGGTPYINHPLAAADLLASDGGVTDVVVLAAGSCEWCGCAPAGRDRTISLRPARPVARAARGPSTRQAAPRRQRRRTRRFERFVRRQRAAARETLANEAASALVDDDSGRKLGMRPDPCLRLLRRKVGVRRASSLALPGSSR